jgi:hypothetical protein
VEINPKSILRWVDPDCPEHRAGERGTVTNPLRMNAACHLEHRQAAARR